VEKLIVLSSFLKGFKRKNAADIINAFFIAERLSNTSSPFTFENRDNNGVDCSEIRRLLFFNSKELDKQQKEERKFHDLGKKVSKFNSNELKWVAQYIRNKDAHLFPEEAKNAQNLLKELRSVLDS